MVPVSVNDLLLPSKSESSEKVRKRVINARKIQELRYTEMTNIFCNAHITSRILKETCTIDEESKNLLRKAIDSLNLSARAYDRILKVSRIIADLAGSEEIKVEHLAEAIQYRSLDRESWAG